MPPARLSALFSATLPAQVAEFARADLHNPEMVRLDVEQTLSPDLTVSHEWVGGRADMRRTRLGRLEDEIPHTLADTIILLCHPLCM